ncbi:MAG: hypothetical protein GTN76_11690 [Candidatus Aenigmarchaeota archaeon]|nr:hypothetical protein [Candidatus Aenigmarchaeota archaeon]NIQ18091.1 hypothetical protein [Candidatus Aenigmarchaeota archaeon]
MKRVVGLLLFFLVVAILSQDVLAAKPIIELRPDPAYISKDSGFILIVDPKTTEKPIRITWAVYDTGNEGIGSFPIVDGNGVCYFSNEDGNATCGPSPFTKSGPTELYIYVVTPSDVENQTEAMDISNIQIPLDDVSRVGNTVYMNFYVPQYDSFTYKIYLEDFSFFTQGTLERDSVHSMYTGNRTINPGTYYFAFFAEENGTYGTNLIRIVIPSGDYLTLETSSSNYMIGENAEVKGTTNADKVSGTIKFPNGTKAMDFETNTKTDNTFSYEFRIPSTWPEGKYNVTTSSPLPEFVTFSAADFIKITPKRVREVINKSDDFNKTVTLKNMGTNKTNLSVTVSGDISDSHVNLNDQELDGGESTTLTISISSVQVNLKGKITVKTNGIELVIPVNVYVEEPGGECPPCPQCDGVQALEITPKFFSQTCLTGTLLTQSIVLENNGDASLTSFTFDVDDVYSDNSLSDLKSTGDLDIGLSGISIAAGQTASVDMEITPYNMGSYKGIVTIKSGGSEAYMLVSLDCFEDMSGDITDMNSELDNLGLATDSDVYNDINYLLGNAQDAYDVGNYPEAKLNLDKARAKIATVNDLGGVTLPAMDMTIPIVVIIVVIVVAVLLYFFKFRKGGAAPLEEEEGFEEEF